MILKANAQVTKEGEKSVFAGLSYYFHGEAPNPGTKPKSVKENLENEMNAMDAATYTVHPMDVGTIKKMVTSKEDKTVIVSKSSKDVMDEVNDPMPT